MNTIKVLIKLMMGGFNEKDNIYYSINYNYCMEKAFEGEQPHLEMVGGTKEVRGYSNLNVGDHIQISSQEW